MKTKQIVFTKPYTAELLDMEYSAPKANEVTVRLEYSAISAGTEKANLIGERNSTHLSETDEAVFPRTVGYSGAGIITVVGENVKNLKVGDRVVVFCGKHKRDITIHENCIIKIPDTVSTKEASMAYISTFPLAAVRKTKVEIGESALVMGLGILGIFAVQQLRASGAYPIVAVDPVKERREFALKMGADFAFDPTEEDFVKKVTDITDGGANVCIEVTGLGAGLIGALECRKEMGRVALLGCTRSSKFEIDYYSKVHGRGISLIGAHTNARPLSESAPSLWTHRDDIGAMIKMISGGRIDFLGMISEIHSPEEAPEVFTRLATEKNFPIGVLFDWTKV